MTAQQLAKKVSEFIKHNSIDTNKYSMDVIVEQYFIAQLSAIEEAGKKFLDQHAG